MFIAKTVKIGIEQEDETVKIGTERKCVVG